jgi:hypothetical protein
MAETGMPIQLSNIDIAEISFVKAGANGLEFVAKSGQKPLLVTIRKTDAVKKVCYGAIYEPDVLDSQGEKATAAEIEKAAWSAMQNHAVIKADHQDPVKAFLCESYIAKAGDPDGYKPGAWVGGVKVEDDALWASIEKGEFKAFSMGGAAEKTPVEKQGPVKKEIHADSMVYATNFKDALTLLQSIAATMAEVTKTIAGKDDAVKKSVDALPAQLAELSKKVADGNALIQKIADTVTDGRATSAAPGSGGGPPVDPSKY